MIRYCCFFLLLLPALGTYAQGHLVLKGTVQETASGFPLPQATLTLQQGKDTLHAGTNSKGKFEFSNLKKGSLVLIADYVGFGADTLQLKLNRDTALMIGLSSANRELTEVVIKSVIPPATVRSDTISFNAQAYPSRPNATVEDLLRKLPGVEIDPDGNVTMQGQKVDKILIGGKTFFIDDLRKATHNLPADIIAQVEVYDSQSDADKAAGLVSTGKSKTINLKLKKKYKEGLVGMLYGGGGTNDSYAAGGNVTGLGARLFSAEVKANNIGDQFTGTENNYAPPATGKPQSDAVHLNYKQNLSKIFTLNAFANYDGNTNSSQGNSAKQTFLADSALLQKDQNTATNKSYNYSVGANVEYKPNDSTYLSWNGSLQPSRQSGSITDSTLLQTLKAGTVYLASSGSSRNSQITNSDNFNQSIDYSRRFKKTRRALRLNFNQTVSTQNQQQDLYTLVMLPGAVKDSIVNQRSTDPVHYTTEHLGALYAEPLSAKLNIQFSGAADLQDNRSAKASDNFDPATGDYDLPDSLTSNRFDNKVLTSQLGLAITGLPKHKFYYRFGLAAQDSRQEDDNQSAGTTTSRSFNSLLPEALLKYNLGKAQNLTLRYNGNSQYPTIDQLQPVPDLSNPYLVKVGNPDLRQAFIQNFNLSYLNFNAENFRNFQLEMDGNLTSHPIASSATTLAGGVQQVAFVNLGQAYQLNARVVYGFPLINAAHGSGSVSSGLTAQQTPGIINGTGNTTSAKGANAEVKLNYHDGNKVFIESRVSASYLNNSYSAEPALSGRTLQQDVQTDASVSLPLAMLAGGHYTLELRNTTGLAGQQSNLLNAYLAKDLGTAHTTQLRLSGFNLLNTAATLSQVSGPGYILTQSTTAEHRLLLLSFVYHFKYFTNGG